MDVYYAHKTEDDKRVQTILDHANGTSKLAADFAVQAFKFSAAFLGNTHDIGKYAEDFQKRLEDNCIKFEHAICGAIELDKLKAENEAKILIPMFQYCIAGHHTGLPDGGTIGSDAESPDLRGRLKRSKYYVKSADYSAYRSEIELKLPNVKALYNLLMQDLPENDLEKRKREQIERYAFFTRYLFSCLKDADFLDTERFFTPEKDRTLKADFQAASAAVEAKLKWLSKNKSNTELQKARQRLLKQATENCDLDDSILLLSMPTGSGKTLCSVKLALDMVQKSAGKLKRVIYVIPYTSIIEQTADAFSSLFGDYADILQHHSNYTYGGDDADLTEQKLQAACENWDSPFVITTTVQFFQSLYHYKSSGLRKLHNMAESVIVFDEVHLLPLEVLQPCLRGVGYITKYLGSKALFLSATMPDYAGLFEKYLPGHSYRQLITNIDDYKYFQKCEYKNCEKCDITQIILEAEKHQSALIVVNSRKSAREIYEGLGGNKYHLSTYMTPNHRSAVIDQIRKDLEDKVTVRVVSTSLIEAGVDLDFQVVFRQLAGLDSILQSGGRCNREGRNKREDSKVYIFSTDGHSRGELSIRAELTKGLMQKYTDITSQDCIQEYYNQLFFSRANQIDANSIAEKPYFTDGLKSIAFRTYAEHFEMIRDDTVSVVVNNCDNCGDWLKKLDEDPCGARRQLQRYSVALKYYSEFLPMLKSGRIVERYKNVFVLTDSDNDYSEEIGLLVERTNDQFV